MRYLFLVAILSHLSSADAICMSGTANTNFNLKNPAAVRSFVEQSGQVKSISPVPESNSFPETSLIDPNCPLVAIQAIEATGRTVIRVQSLVSGMVSGGFLRGRMVSFDPAAILLITSIDSKISVGKRLKNIWNNGGSNWGNDIIEDHVDCGLQPSAASEAGSQICNREKGSCLND